MERYSGILPSRIKTARYRRNYKGQIFLPSPSALAVWEHEITGQMSDGAWENAEPSEHWVFWSDMTPTLGSPKVVADGYPEKDSYNLTGLIEYVGDRMVAYGKMAKAGGKGKAIEAADSMPKTYEEFMEKKEAGDYKYAWEKEEMAAVTPEVAKKFYEVKYDESDLRRDLASIKQAIKNVNPRSAPEGPKAEVTPERLPPAGLAVPSAKEMEHEVMRIETMGPEKVLRRLKTIKNPQKLFNFALALKDAGMGDASEQAYEKLDTLGYPTKAAMASAKNVVAMFLGRA